MKPRRRRWQLISAALVFVPLAASGRSEQKDGDAPAFVISPGAMLGWAGENGLRFDGEISGTFYWNSFGIGVATGGGSTRFYGELQPVALVNLEGANSKSAPMFFVGVNPGVVLDWSGPSRTGGQVTLWTAYVFASGHQFLPLPIVPFVRLEVFSHEYVGSAGAMLKIPLSRGNLP
jgi:hypothetical protein